MNVPLPHGFRAAGVRCGLKAKADALDLGLLVAEEAAPAWALFTRNRLNGAHIAVCRDHLARSGGWVRAVLVNSGNANCATGPEGVADAHRLCAALADRIGCATEQVLMVSTGVIGARLDAGRVEGALDALLDQASTDGGPAFARAIMTTDTVPKGGTAETADGHRVTGFAKGSGMIHPDMATMLAFLLTDAPAAEGAAILSRVADRTFHRTTVDGDTSPNDTLLLVAGPQNAAGTGGTGTGSDEPEATLTSVARDLARAVARDGEGATRLVTIHVSGAQDEAEAAHLGRAIARSPLVKTAIAGRDPNWGRILSAASSAGVAVDPDTTRLAIGDVLVYRDGRPVVENEPAAHDHLATHDEVHLSLTLSRGRGAAEVWTCDLTADYVEINAHYRS